MGRLDEAREDCDAAIQRAPKLARAYFNRGNVWIMGKALNKAFADFTQALALDPKHLGAWANRGSVRALKGDLDGAIADYTAALKVDPDYVQGYINRASAYARKRDLERVETDLERAAALVAKLPGREAEVTRSRIAAMRRSIGRLWLRRLLKVRSVEELAPFLELRDVEVRRTGYKLLLGLAHKEDRALALAGLRDPDKFVRTYAVAVLAKIGDSESVPAMLARMTTDNEEAVRGAIVMAVVRLGRLEQVIQPLVDQLAREKSTYVVEVLDRCLRGLTQVEPQVTVDLARLEPGRSKLVAFWNSWWKARAKEKR